MSHGETLEEVQRAGRERLHPSLTNPNWLVLRERRKIFQGWLQNIAARDLWVLDVGGRIQPYRILLADKCARYFALDLKMTPLVDVLGRAEQLPFANQQFDLVFCTQVLEYVPDPGVVIAEIHRVLKPQGYLLLSVPSVFPRDSEVEHWRFLPLALKQLLSEFSRIDLAPEGNSAVGFVRTASVCMVTFVKPAILASLLRLTIVPALNLFGALLQMITSEMDDRFTANFSVLAEK
jgi:SAM-dependent methyltransferase